jgi:hypothetical protein
MRCLASRVDINADAWLHQPTVVTAPDAFHSRGSLAKAGWWGRLFASLLFAFYVNSIPIHLAAERHLDDGLGSVAASQVHHDDHDDTNHDDSNHHTPHRASDHTLILTAPAKASGASALAVFLPSAVTSVLLPEPEPQPPLPVFERSRPPGESPPDPLQPRAPPLA